MLAADRDTLFRGWFAEHGGAVARVARAYTTDPDDGRDLMQEILLQVWRSLPTFDRRADPATWSYRVALNTALGWHRRASRQRRRQRPLHPDLDPPDPSPSADHHADQRERIGELYAAIRQLPPTDAALVLLHLDGLTYSQIAEVVGITATHVGVKLTRARKTLRTLLAEDQP